MHPRPSGVASASAATAGCIPASAALSAAATAAASAPAASPATHFLTHMLALSASQIAREAGFSHTRQSNLHIIAEVAAQYIHSIGVSSAAACTASGRSECNAHDVLTGLSDLGVEFSELRQWKELSESSPFAPCMPPFPLAQPVILVEPATIGTGGVASAAAPGSAADSAKGTALFPPRPPHIPVCLPALPPRRTWVASADLTAGGRSAPAASAAALGGVDSSAATRKRKVSENRKLESALVTLHQAAAKAALEQAQLQAQQDLRMQEAISAEPRPVPVPAAPVHAAAPAIAQPPPPRSSKADPVSSGVAAAAASSSAPAPASTPASASTVAVDAPPPAAASSQPAAATADGPSAMDTDEAALNATVPLDTHTDAQAAAPAETRS